MPRHVVPQRGLIAVAPIVVFFLFVQKYIIKGMIAGSINPAL